MVYPYNVECFCVQIMSEILEMMRCFVFVFQLEVGDGGDQRQSQLRYPLSKYLQYFIVRLNFICCLTAAPFKVIVCSDD